MIWFFTPYAQDKNLFNTIEKYCRLVPEQDWICILDGDTMFLQSDFGHLLQNYIDKYPDTGLFTCYASRCHYLCQQFMPALMEERDIVYHKNIADQVFKQNGYEVEELNRRIAGHLMMFRKSTWNLIKTEVRHKVESQNKKILGVDTKISNAVLKYGLKIRLMKGVYIFHFMRFNKSIDDNSHLL